MAQCHLITRQKSQEFTAQAERKLSVPTTQNFPANTYMENNKKRQNRTGMPKKCLQKVVMNQQQTRKNYIKISRNMARTSQRLGPDISETPKRSLATHRKLTGKMCTKSENAAH